MPYLVFDKNSSFESSRLKFKPYRNIMDIRYKEFDDKPSRSIYLRTPQMTLVHLEEDKNNYYMTLRVSRRDTRFWDLLAQFDCSVMEEMANDQESWGFSADRQMPLMVIEDHFMPTLKLSVVCGEHCLRLVVPKTDEVAMFDTDENEITFEDIDIENKISFILLLDGAITFNRVFRLRFVVEQMKVTFTEQEHSESRSRSRRSRSRSRSKKDDVKEENKEQDEQENKEQEEEEKEEEALKSQEELPTGKFLMHESDDELQSNWPGQEDTKLSHRPKREVYEEQHSSRED